MKVKTKKSVEIPPDIRSFTERVLSTPYENVADVLTGFSWKYDKGDFHHWIPLFNYFDNFFEKCIRSRGDLTLEARRGEVETPFPTHATITILRVTTRVLENCTNKHFYQSYEHLTDLLAAPESEVVIWALQALVTFLRKTHHATVRFHGYAALTTRLFDLCKGWGGTEQGLEMTACAKENSQPIEGNIRHGTTLHFEFYNEKSDQSGGLKVIHSENLHQLNRSAHDLLDELIQTYNVPRAERFRLLSRLRIVCNFASLEGRRALVKTRLLAFCVLIQSNPLHEEMLAFFSSEPEFMNELVELLQTDDGIPLELRTLAIRALAVQLVDRSRHSAVISSVGVAGQNGLLSILLQDSIECICAGDRASNSRKPKYNASFVEALLVLVGALISSSSGNVNLSEAGFIPALLPLIRDRSPAHVTLVCSAVKILESFMDYSASASPLFRGMNGLTIMIARLEAEVQATATDDTGGPSSSNQGTKRKKSNDEPAKQNVSYVRRLLMKSLLRAIALASYAPTVGVARRLEDADARALYGCLKSIFVKARQFGGALFAFAATVTTDLIHNDPLCFGALDEAGVPDAFLQAVCEGVLPSSEAVCSIPNTLVALCLKVDGLQKVTERRALACLVDIFTSKQYTKSLSGDTSSILGAGVDELFRHVPSLKDDGIQHVVVRILKLLCFLGGDPQTVEEITAELARERDPQLEISAEVLERAQQTGMDPILQDSLSHAAKMLEALLSNSETSRQFAQNGGVELLLKFYTLPKLPPSFVSSSQSNPLLSIFRSLTHNNCPNLHVSVPAALSEQLDRTLIAAEKLGDVCVPSLDAESREQYAKLTASTSGLTGVAGTIARTSTPMLTEMCKGDKALISTLGELERRVLHQLSLADGWKERKVRMQKEAEEAAQNASPLIGAGDDSEAERTDTEVDAMDIEQDYLLPEMPPSLPTEVEMQLLNGAKYPHPKKAPDDVAYDVLQHFVATVRSLYTSIAKANHTPARRRDESFGRPTISMKAAALGLALVLKRNLDYEISGQREAGTQRYVRHLSRLVEEVQLVLFDSRRHCCHTLILNYFVAVQGFASLLGSFSNVVSMLWETIEDVSMQAGPSTSSDPSEEAEQKSAVEMLMLAFLNLFTQLTTPRLLFQSSQTASLLVIPLPSVEEGEEPAEDNNSQKAEDFVKKLQDSVLGAVLPVWSNPLFVRSSPSVTGNVIGILNSCLDGAGTLSAAFRAIRSDGRFAIGRNAAPDPNMVQQIIDMGFTRPRAVQALRRVGQNSVELALEWLVNHPDEPLPENTEGTGAPNEQELANAMTASLNQVETPPQPEASAKTSSTSIHVLDLVTGAVSILEKSPISAFSISSFIMTLCNRNDGADRETVIQWFIATLNKTVVPTADLAEIRSRMNAVAHLLALMMAESVPCREMAIDVCMVTAIMRALDQWEALYKEPEEIPTWIEGLLLVLDFLSQTQRRQDDDSSDDSSSHSSGEEMAEEPKKSPLEKILGKWGPAGPLQIEERSRLVELSVKLLQHLQSYGKEWTPTESSSPQSAFEMADPAGVTQAVIQLLASITRCHQTALKVRTEPQGARSMFVLWQFLHKDGVDLLLSLPASCLMPRHECYISSILKHILEDEVTLQLLMESEIKNVFSTQRRPLGQLPIYDWEQMPVRNFLQKMSLLAYRSPSVFAKAVGNLCTLVEAAGNQVICLKKPRASGNKIAAGSEKTTPDPSKKNNKRVVLLSFVEVIDKLLDHVMGFDMTASSMITDRDQEMTSARPSAEEADPTRGSFGDALPEASSLERITEILVNGQGRQGEETTRSEHPLYGSSVSRRTLMLHRDVILQIMILNMLSEFCLLYGSTVGVLLKRDTELAQKDAPAVTEMHSSLLKRVLHEHLSWNVTSQGTKPSLGEEASRFLQAVCVRSSEGRKRILTEIVGILSWATNLSPHAAKQTEVDMPFVSVIGAPSGAKIKTLIDLIGSLLVSSSAVKSSNQGANRQTPPTTGLTVELIRSMRHVGVVAALIQALELVDMDHPEASKAVYSIIKPLEILTRSIPIALKKAVPQQNEPPSTPAEPQPEEQARLSRGEAFMVSTSPPRPPEHMPSDLMEEDLNEIEDAAQLYYEALNEMVEETLGEAMHSNDEDAMDEDDDDDEEDDSESESSSGTPSFQEEGSHEEHVEVEEESEELENEHEELEASEEDGMDEEDEEDEMEDGEDEEDASADMELDGGEDWDEDVAIREYTEALDRIESVMRGAEEGGEALNARIFTHGDVIQPNLRSVLGNMLGNFLGPGDDGRRDRSGIRYRLHPRERNANPNGGFMVQSVAPAQHRLLVRPQNQGNGNDDGMASRILPETFGRRFGQLPPLEGRWRQFGYQQGAPPGARILHGRGMPEFDYDFVPEDQLGGRGGFGMGGGFDGERHGADASLHNSRTTGANWMHRMQGHFEQLLSETLPREAPPQSPQLPQSPEAPVAQDEASAPVAGQDGEGPQTGATAEENQPVPVPEPEPAAEAPARRERPAEDVEMDAPAVEDAMPNGRGEEMEVAAQEEVPTLPEGGPPAESSSPEAPDAQEDVQDGTAAESSAPQEGPEEEALPAEIVTAAEQAGIDPAFLQALPRPLQLEVLTEHGVSIAQLTQPAQQPPAERAETSGAQEAGAGGVDPEFLAALPPDIREEVLESQRAAERIRDVERRLTEGQGDEVANMIASLPDDIREEVLLYSGPDILANLPPNLLAEGQRMRERHSRYDGRDGDGPLTSNLFFRRLRQNAGLEREARGHVRKDRKEELEAPSAIDVQGLTSLVGLLRMNAPVIKTQLQKLFLNLCVREDSRRHITRLLVQRLQDSDLERSRDAPSIMRRVLDLLSYLARHQSSKVAEMLMEVRMLSSPMAKDASGKLPMNHVTSQPRALEVLLEMLGQPLCLRSVSTLEQDLQLLEVILQSAMEQKKETQENANPQTEGQPGASSSQPQDQLSSLQHLSTRQLTLLPGIIGRDGLSDRAYKSAASVVKLLVDAAPVHRFFLLMALNSHIDEQTQTACALLSQITSEGMNRASAHSLSGTGTLVLRILHSMESLVEARSSTEEEAVHGVVAGLAEVLEQMWADLSPVIAEIESQIKNSSHHLAEVDANTSARVLPFGASQTLPFIESFFVLCTVQTQQSQDSSPGAESPALMNFAERHRVLLNAFLRQTPSLLEGSFKSLIQSPRLIDFDNKRLYFRGKLRPDDRMHYGTLRINVRREHVFEDSFYQLRHRSADALKSKLSVQFTGEEGIDAGGVSREWYQVMAREIFNPNLALFIAVPDGASTFQPNPNSIIQNDRGVNHLDFFRFVGRLVGKAVYDGQMIDAHFTRSFYKHMLNQPLSYQDLEAVDLDFYKQMKWILDNDITDILAGQAFAAEADFFGRKEVIELKEGGAKIPIMEGNKREYVSLMTHHKMTTAIREQIKAFQEGFWELVPKDLVVIFNDHELELIISGLPEVDVGDIKSNTEYTGYTAASQVIQWFWSVVEEFDAENLALLLQFVTGTSKVPLDGFANLQGISGPQKFQIHKSYAAEDRLPSAHTCFNQLDLPEYKSREQLKDRLLLAIHEGREGFGFG